MATRLGNANVSAMLRSAQASQNALNAYNDAQAAFEWEYGPKDQAAFNKYTSYLNDRVKSEQGLDTLAGASKALSLQKSVFLTQQQYGSARIMRDTIAIDEGNGTMDQKLADIGNLYQQAIQLGDDSLAMSLRQKYDSTAITLNNQMASAASARAAASSAQQTANKASYDDQLNQFDQDLQSLSDHLHQSDTGWSFTNNEGKKTDVFSTAAQIAQQKLSYMTQMAQSGLLSPSESRTILSNIQKLQTGKVADIGGKSFTLSELSQAAVQTQMGNSPYARQVDNSGQIKLSPKAIVSTQWVNGPDGQAHLMPVYGDQNMISGQQKAVQADLKAHGIEYSNGVATDPKTGQKYQLITNADGSVSFAEPGQVDPYTGEFKGLGRYNVGKGTFEQVSPQELEADMKAFQQGKLQQSNPLAPTPERFKSLGAQTIDTFQRTLGNDVKSVSSFLAHHDTTHPNNAISNLAQDFGGAVSAIANPVKSLGGAIAKALTPPRPTPQPSPQSLRPNAMDIINRSTNWGQAAQQLQQSGYNPTQYDAQLHAKYAPSTIQQAGNFLGNAAHGVENFFGSAAKFLGF